MAEKRKLPARDRGGPAAKKRITDAAPPPSLQARRRKTATPAPPTPRPKEPDEEPLPTKIRDDGKLPTISKPQPQVLSTTEYQSYAESGVVAAALHRSKMNWLHNCPFEKYWIKPSKKKNQPQPPINNPPKDSMIRLGQCTMVVEPHYFEVMLYAVRRPQSHPPPPPAHQQQQQQQQQQHPPQPKQIVHVQYTAPNNAPNNTPNNHEYRPPPVQHTPQPRNPPPNPPTRPTHPPAPPTPHTPHTPYAHNTTPQQQQHHSQQAGHGTPSAPPSNQPPIAPPQQNGHPQIAPDPNSQPVKPSQDPVIQLLATRAAANPELKALMRVVASSNANQEQLRTFQAHIDELNAIIASRNQREAQNRSPQVKTEVTSRASPAMAPHPTNGVPNGAPTLTQTRSPASHPPQNINPYPPPQSHPAPIRSKNPQQPPPGPYGRPQYHPPTPQPPKQPDIKAVVFEFVMPAGAGQGVTGDRYLFPENMILDYFPGNTTVIASFLAITKDDPSETANGGGKKAIGGKAKAKKSKVPATPGTPAPAADIPNGTPAKAPAPQPLDQKTPDTPKPNGTNTEPEKNKLDTATITPTPTPTKPEVKEYYQPVTMRFHSSNPRIIEPLGRVVRPTPEVQKHMNDVMDRLERADIEYLALRLPRERRGGAKDAEEGDAGRAETPKPNNRRKSVGLEKEGRGTPQAQAQGQARDDRGKSMDSCITPSVEDELKDSYDPPNCLVPLR